MLSKKEIQVEVLDMLKEIYSDFFSYDSVSKASNKE